MHTYKALTVLALFIAIAGAGLFLGTDAYAAADSIERPETEGSVGTWTSLALDDNDYPVVSYLDQDRGTVHMLHCGNETCSSGNSIEELGSNVFGYTALRLDGSGYPMVAFTTSPGVGQGYDLEFIHCNDANCTGDNESHVTVDGEGSVDQFGYWTSMVLDGSGYPVIAYERVDMDPVVYGDWFLRIAHCDDLDCSSHSGAEIGTSNTTERQGFGNSIALDSDGYPVVSYVGVDASGDVQVKLLHCVDDDCSSTSRTIEDLASHHSQIASHRSVQTALVLDTDTPKRPIIAYQGVDGALNVVHCDDPNCAGDESGNIVTVDSEIVPSGDDEGIVGLYVSMVLDGNGYPVIAYHTHAYGDLKLLRCGDADCSSDNTITTVEVEDHAGAYTSVALNDSGYPVITHNYQDTEDLGVVVCGSSACDASFWEDSDLDGCTDGDEDTLSLDSSDFWDFFDTPDTNGLRDRVVNDDDVSAVQARYGADDDDGNADINRNSDPLTAPPDAPAYHPAFDRGEDLAPPDGIIVLSDILAAAGQSETDCSP